MAPAGGAVVRGRVTEQGQRAVPLEQEQNLAWEEPSAQPGLGWP